jgi:hypothetical protein
MLVPICQVGEITAYSGDVEVTHGMIDGWVGNFGEHEKVPMGMGHLNPNYALPDTDKKPLCWADALFRAGDYCMARLTDWTPEGKSAAVENAFKNFSIETTGGDEDRIKYIAALGAYDSAVDFKTPDGERFQPFDFAGALGDEGQVMLAAAMGYTMPYKEPPKKITDLFDDDKGPGIWTSAFNSSYKKNQDDGEAAKAAWGAVKNAGYSKGKDGKYSKSKQAATAAKGATMGAVKEKALAALRDVQGWLEGSPEGEPQVNPAPVTAAAPPVGEPVILEAQVLVEPPQVIALRAEMDELKKTVASQKVEFVAASLHAESKELCSAMSAAPRFEKPLAQVLASIPLEAEVVIAEADDPEKVVKASAREWFKNVLLAKGTEKLEDPAKLTKPPKQKEVKQFATPKEGLPEDEAALEELNTKARSLSKIEGIPIGEAQAKVLTEYRKEQKEA